MDIRLEHLEDDVKEMKHMMQLLLEKQGLADDRLDHNLKGSPLTHSYSPTLLTNASTANISVKDGILSPLVHRRSSSSDWTWCESVLRKSV
jgi:hypothetical protein